MNIDIVLFEESEDVVALYRDGHLLLTGDHYHNHISYQLDGWINGIKYLIKEFDIDISLEVHFHSLDEESQCNFREDGWRIPETFPILEYILEQNVE